MAVGARTGATVQVVRTTALNANTTDSSLLTPPTTGNSAVSGDLMILRLFWNSATARLNAIGTTSLSGWSTIGGVLSTGGKASSQMFRKSFAGETAAYSIQFNAAITGIHAVIEVFSGHDTTTPVGAPQSLASSGSPINFPATNIVTAVAGSALYGGIDNTSSSTFGAPASTTPAGLTQLDAAQTTNATSRTSMDTLSYAVPSSGTSSRIGAVTPSSGSNYNSWMVEVRSAAAAANPWIEGIPPRKILPLVAR